VKQYFTISRIVSLWYVFCGWCLKDCAKDAHSHVARCGFALSKDPVWGTKEDFNESNRLRTIDRIDKYVKSLDKNMASKVIIHSKDLLKDLRHNFQ
jgi:hypothetical protein